MCNRGLGGAFAVCRHFHTRKSAVCWRPEAASAHPNPHPPPPTHHLQNEKKKKNTTNTGLVWLLSAEKEGLGNVCIRLCIVSGWVVVEG